MNLHAIVTPAISSVNPPIRVQIHPSIGYTTNSDGSRTPSYGPATSMMAQKQPLSTDDIKHMDALNIQGVRCKLYMLGNWNAIVRADQKGGDKIVFPDGTTWLVTEQMEDWGKGDWVALLCTRQNP